MMDWQTLKTQQKTVEKVLHHAVFRGKLAHAYLFEGPRGTGKRATALLLAQTLYCEAEKALRPCGTCRNCRRIADGNHPDVIRIRPDDKAATIKKDQISFLIREFAYHGVESSIKVFILENAEKLTVQAENSLLKFIEEPHPGTVAILITEQMHQLLDTILSRCEVLTFVPLSETELCSRLEKEGQPHHLAKLAAGLMHDYTDALDLCNEPWFADAYSLVLQLTQKLCNRAEPALLFIYEKFFPVFNDNQRLSIGLDMLLLWYRDVLALQIKSPGRLLYDREKESLDSQRLKLTAGQLLQMEDDILEARRQLDAHVNGLSVIERLVIRSGGNGSV